MFLLCLCLRSHQQLRSYGDGPRLKVSSGRLVKPAIEPVTPGLQGKRFIYYTTAAPLNKRFNFDKTVLQWMKQYNVILRVLFNFALEVLLCVSV